MEYLNKVEFAGVIGTVRKNDVADSKVANFSLCVENLFKKNDGTSIIETTWIQVVAWNGSRIDFESIEKGKNVKVDGRLRTCKYTSSDGNERCFYEVIAHSVKVIEN